MALLERLVLALELDANKATADAKQFQQEIGRTLGPVENLQGNLRKGFQVGAGAVGALASFEALGAAAQAAALFVSNSARAAAEDQRSQTILAGVIRNTTDARASDIAVVEEQIDGLARLTGVADDQLRPAFASLVRATRDTAEASELLGVALDTAAGTGVDVASVADALAKAFAGNTRALRALTPEFASIIKEGATSADIVNRLRESFGGLAEAGANPLDRISVAFSEAQESIGAAFLPSIEAAADALNDAQPAIELVAQATTAYVTVTREAAEAARNFARDLVSIVPGAEQAARSLGNFLTIDQGNILSSAVLFRQRFEEVSDAIRASRGIPLRYASEVEALGNSFTEAAFKALDLGNVMSKALGALGQENAFENALDQLTQVRTTGAAAGRARVLSEFEIESAARNVTRANEELAEAEKALADLRRGASEEERRRAEFEITNAAQRSRVAQVRLAEAENELRRTQARGTTAEQARAQLAYEQALLDVQNATEDQSEAQRRKNDLDRRGAEGSKELADAVRRVEDAQFGVKSAYESQRRLFEQDAQSGGGPGAAVGRSMESAFKSAQKAASDIVTEMVKAGKPIDEIIAKANELRVANLEAGKAAGLPDSLLRKADAYYEYLIALARYQNYLNTTFKSGQDPDGYEGLALGQQIEAARGRFEAAGRAAGGSVMGGQWYEVNESRREFFKPTGSGTIFPIGAGGMGTGTVVIDARGAVIASSVDMERLVTDALERARKRGWN